VNVENEEKDEYANNIKYDMIIEICQTLEYLQNTMSFSHNDLHSKNIMIDTNNKIKIIDYGSVKCDISGCYKESNIKLCAKNAIYYDNFCENHKLNKSHDLRLLLSSLIKSLPNKLQTEIINNMSEKTGTILTKRKLYKINQFGEKQYFHNFYKFYDVEDDFFTPNNIIKLIKKIRN
jgi:hypothetical protein